MNPEATTSPALQIQRNRAHYTLLNQDCRYYYQVGGRWSAKTTEIIIHILINMINNDGLKVAVFRKTYESIRDSIYADAVQIIEDIGLSEYFQCLKSPFRITCTLNNSIMIFKGAQDPERLKGLAGVHWVFLEELNEFEQMDFETIDQGIRGKGIKQRVFMAHNPVPKIAGDPYWFETLFCPIPLTPGRPYVFDIPELGKVAALKTTYQHNKFTPPHVATRLEGYKITNPPLYKLWALGDYTEIKGAVLKNWDEVPCVPSNIDLIGYGLDFGFSEDPCAMLAVYGNRNEIWLEGQIYSTNLTNRDLIKRIQELKIDPLSRIVADSAEPKSIEDLFRSGLRGIRGVKKRANYKEDMANVLQGYKIHIVAGDGDLKKEISTWSWDEDKNGKLIPKLRDGGDHYMDCLVMLLHDYKGSKRMSVGGR